MRAWARKTGAVPSEKEVEDRNLGHAVFRSWHPRRVNGRAESGGSVKKDQNEGEVPTIEVGYVYKRSEQEREGGGKRYADRRGRGQQHEDDHGKGCAEQRVG